MSVTREHLYVSIDFIKHLLGVPVTKRLLWKGHASLGLVIRILCIFLLIMPKETC